MALVLMLRKKKSLKQKKKFKEINDDNKGNIKKLKEDFEDLK